MSQPSPDDLLAALRDFTARVDALDPDAPLWGEVEVGVGEQRVRLPLREPVAAALVRALHDYHDPRDNGSCGHCGGPRLGADLMCRDCGRPGGLFGQLVFERMTRHSELNP